jgi:hypothetical protein
MADESRNIGQRRLGGHPANERISLWIFSECILPGSICIDVSGVHLCRSRINAMKSVQPCC